MSQALIKAPEHAEAAPDDDLLDGLEDPDAEAPATQLTLSDPRLQQMLVAAILKDRECLAAAAKAVTANSFPTRGQKLAVGIAVEFFREHGLICPPSILKPKLKEALGDRPDAAAHIAELNAILDYTSVEAPSYWIAEIHRLARRHRVAETWLAYTDPASKKHGDIQALYDAVSEIRRIGTAEDPEESTLLGFEDLDDVEPMEWQIDQHFPRNGTVCIFGPSGAGKSFVALDMAFSVASGSLFLGRHAVVQGNVLYIVSEGKHGVRQRRDAWINGHPDAQPQGHILFSARCHALNDQAEADSLLEKALAALKQIDLIFIDTLSRNFGVGDLDSNKDMRAFLSVVDHVRERTKATVVIVHHTGHNNEDRETGAKSLRNYCDSSILVRSDPNGISVSCKKQKDAAEFVPYVLRKVISGDSLYLDHAGTAATVKQQQVNDDKVARVNEVVALVPEVSLTASPTPDNTITVKQILQKTSINEKYVRKALELAESQGLICAMKLGTSVTSPVSYFRCPELTPHTLPPSSGMEPLSPLKGG